MIRILRTFALAAGLACASSALAQSHDVRLALDWVPNTNHTGVYVALAHGWYQEAGVDLEVLPYGNVTPNVLLTSGRADVGISGNQGVLSAAATGEPVVSIAAILSTNTAGLAVLADSGIESPADLDGKLYAAFGGPTERPIIETVIQHAGGEGEFESAVLGVSGFDALLSERADFIWIYEGWDGVRARHEGVDLRLFNFVDYGIDDHYNPVFTATPEQVEARSEALSAFLGATRRGYEFAAEHPDEAAEMLLEGAPDGSFSNPELVRDSQAFVSEVYRDGDRRWGVQREAKWRGFTEFLVDAGVFTGPDGDVVEDLEIDALYTNALLP